MKVVHDNKPVHRICEPKECDKQEFRVMEGKVIFAKFCCEKGFKKSLGL